MFDRFWQQYPQGSILSELLQIHGETYIVKITLKSAEQTLVSTLAAADRLEVAETTAHRQALEILGLAVNAEPAVLSTATLVDSVPDVTVSATPAAPVVPDPIPVEMSPISPDQGSAAVEPEPTVNPNNAASTVAEAPAQKELAMSTPLAQPLDPESLPGTDEELPLPATPTKSRTKKAPVAEPVSEPIPEPESEMVMAEELPAPAFALRPVQEIADEVPLTVTDMIPLINMELKRLNWTKEQGRDYMVTLYNKRASALLSDEELFGLLQHLKAEPGPA
jgi:hypothetical protein